MANQHSVDRPTIRSHKRQFVWQILAPMILVLLIGLTAGGLVISATVSGQGQTRVWTDVSMVWLLVPALFFALTFLLILVTTIYGMSKLLQVIPHYSGKTQVIFVMLSAETRKLADRAARPFVWLRQAGAVIKSIFRQ